MFAFQWRPSRVKDLSALHIPDFLMDRDVGFIVYSDSCTRIRRGQAARSIFGCFAGVSSCIFML